MQLLKDAATRINLTLLAANSSSLPPASIKSFLKERHDIPGVVLANHASHFINKYDDVFNLICFVVLPADSLTSILYFIYDVILKYPTRHTVN